jgi:hypothetical protein
MFREDLLPLRVQVQSEHNSEDQIFTISAIIEKTPVPTVSPEDSVKMIDSFLRLINELNPCLDFSRYFIAVSAQKNAPE